MMVTAADFFVSFFWNLLPSFSRTIATEGGNEWLVITRHFATALSRLLNAFQAGGIGKLQLGSLLARFVMASQARSVSEANGYL